MKIISLGAGVQSSAMLLMGIAGKFSDMPDAAIFADTQGEPQFVYDWLEKLKAQVWPFPIHKVSVGNLGRDYFQGRKRAAIPAFSRSPAGQKVMMGRFCSKTYKVEVINRTIRQLVGPRGKAESWIGISTDEALRGYKPSGLKWLTKRYPLLDAGIGRTECSNYVESVMGERPPKSACLFCPFHDDAYWVSMKRDWPGEFAKAVEFDDSIRTLSNDRWTEPRYIHKSLKPLSQVRFLHEHQPDMFTNECEGMCGV